MMAGSDSTQQSIRKVLGAIKDSTTLGLAKVNSEYKELDVAIVKATNHEEQLAKEKHMRAIFDAVSATRPRADVAYCINALARRLAKTHNWAVAIKILIVIHRALREVDPTFREELINYTRSRGLMLNLSHFKDDSSPNAWDYSAWVRMYALYLEERLECFRVLGYDVETEHATTSGLDTVGLLEHLPALQQLLFRLLACQPEGAALYNTVIRYALSMVAGESIKIYSAINAGTLNLVDKFFEMQRHDALRALEIYRRAGQQVERLSEFYEICKGFDLGRGQNFAKVEKPPASFIAAMEEYVKDAPTMINRSLGETRRLEGPKPLLAIEHKVNDEHRDGTEAPEDDEQQESAPLQAETSTSGSTEAPEEAPSADTDLLGLDNVNQVATELDEKNAQALAIVGEDSSLNSSKTPDATSASTGWELALVGAPSSNGSAIAESKLVGGLDKLTLDSLYDDAIARRSNQSGGYYMGQVAPNPFEAAVYPQDPFYVSSTVAPPANVQMAAMAQQQALMIQQQQHTLAQGGGTNNPFGNPYGAQEYPPPYQQQNPYKGFM